jgi:hypothetical protein
LDLSAPVAPPEARREDRMYALRDEVASAKDAVLSADKAVSSSVQETKCPR